ncbi:MAG: EAL domain-containing protein [Nakamurella sp.]
MSSSPAVTIPAGVPPTMRPPDGPGRRPHPSAVIAGLFVVAVAVAGVLVGVATGGDSAAAAATNNLGQLAAAVLATVASGSALSRMAGAQRRAWLLVTIACGCWAIGQLIWCYVEVVLGQEIPQVSGADLFFLAFTGLMAFAVWPTAGLHTDRLHAFLDGFIIGMSLLAISWATSIDTIASTETDLLGLLINLAYPCGDIVVLTIVLLSVSRQVRARSSLTVVAAAMALIAVSDGFYAYLSAADDFSDGSISGLGWTVGFGLIGCAALASGRSRRDAPQSVIATHDSSPGAGEPRAVSMLPYIPLGAALLVVAIDRSNNDADRVTNAIVIVTFVGVLFRQYLTIKDNASLTRRLENRRLELQEQAFADQLTGLPNRALFTNRVVHALELHRRDLRPLALLFVDLDDFKAVNDTLGHPVGDQLVIKVAERLRGALRSSDTVARFGGDEFAVLVEGDTDPVEVGDRLVDALRSTFVIGTAQLSISASIGIAEVPADQGTPTLDELYSRADIAMYAVKRAGKGQVALYESSMVVPEAADLRYRPLLIAAMRSGDIACVFQPIVDLQTGQVRLLEALARWRVDGELIAQDYFLKLAGRLKLLQALTDLMLDRACAQLADWSVRLDRGDLQVSVNVPPGIMADRSFPARVAQVLDRHGIGPDRLVLEITEETLLGDIAAAQLVATRLRQMGVQLWLDDFGIGYSSLLSLRQIELHAVKIDIAFIANIDDDPSAERFLRALLALGRDLDLLVIAEGVERTAQSEILRGLGCQLAQGYLFARPAPAGEFEDLLLGQGTARPASLL